MFCGMGPPGTGGDFLTGLSYLCHTAEWLEDNSNKDYSHKFVLCITIKQACYSKYLRIVCVKIMQEVWRCEGDNVSLHIQKDFKRLKGEDYNE